MAFTGYSAGEKIIKRQIKLNGRQHTATLHYLSNYGYSSDEINCIVENIPSLIKSALILNQSVVCSNLEYLIKLGIKNYKEVFNTYYDMFLMDPTKFYEVFNKYDQDDLIDKLEKNVGIIEYL